MAPSFALKYVNRVVFRTTGNLHFRQKTGTFPVVPVVSTGYHSLTGYVSRSRENEQHNWIWEEEKTVEYFCEILLRIMNNRMLPYFAKLESFWASPLTRLPYISWFRISRNSSENSPLFWSCLDPKHLVKILVVSVPPATRGGIFYPQW